MLGRTYWWGSHKIKRVTPVSFLVSSHGVSDLTSETLNIFDQIKHLSACLWGTQLSWQFERNRGILFCRWPNNETGFCLLWFHLPGRRNFFSYFGQIFRTVASHIAKCRDSPKYCGSRRKNETCFDKFFLGSSPVNSLELLKFPLLLNAHKLSVNSDTRPIILHSYIEFNATLPRVYRAVHFWEDFAGQNRKF